MGGTPSRHPQSGGPFARPDHGLHHRDLRVENLPVELRSPPPFLFTFERSVRCPQPALVHDPEHAERTTDAGGNHHGHDNGHNQNGFPRG